MDSDKTKIPKHVAIIMDGNRRFAKKNGCSVLEGHKSGAINLTNIVKEAAKIGVEVLTVYSFSTENWKRDADEINGFIELLAFFLRSKTAEMVKEGVKFETIGDLARFPEDMRELITNVKRETSDGSKITLVMALNYGGRDEICRAVKQIIRECSEGNLTDVTEELISKNLDTASFADPELLIRSGGEFRISNFLLWQLAYSEIYCSDLLWPEFSVDEFLNAIVSYQKRERRLGGT